MNIVTGTRESLAKDQRGVIMIEAAACFIFLIVIFLGLVTLSFVIKDYYGIYKVAREGAREACITGDINRGYDRALQTAWLWGLDTDRLTVRFERDYIGNRYIETCIVTYKVSLFNKVFPELVGGSRLSDYEITGRATFGWWDST